MTVNRFVDIRGIGLWISVKHPVTDGEGRVLPIVALSLSGAVYSFLKLEPTNFTLLLINHTEGRTFDILATEGSVLVCLVCCCTGLSSSVQEFGAEELFGENSLLITLFVIFVLQHAIHSRIIRWAMSAARTVEM
jgi:hypothetical protein